MVLVMVLALVVGGCAAGPSPKGSSTPSPAVSPEGSPSETPPATPAGISLTVTEPQDNTITDADKIEVKGHTNPEAVVSINEVMTTADANGSFTATVNLAEGPNVIEVVASDEEGDQAEASLIVTFVKGG